MNYFEELNNINVNGKTEQKNGLTYLSWAWAWGELKKKYPMSYYTVYEDARGLNYFTDGKTGYVKTGVTVVYELVYDGDVQNREPVKLEHIEYLPIMDFRNKSIPAENITSFDVNKAIQRSLTKAVARHGLGLYIYASEDLPECEVIERETVKVKPITKTQIDALKMRAESKGVDAEKILDRYGVGKFQELNNEQWNNAMNILEKQ